MFCNDDFRQNGNFGYGDGIDININNANTNTNTTQNVNMNMNENFDGGYGMVGSPIIEPGRERVVQRSFVHEVRHVCPFM